MDITIRRATEADKDFLVMAITEAEKSGSDTISYCAMFSITGEEFRGLVSNILDEDMNGQEMCISNFLIAEVDGERAATLGTWIEGMDGMSSNMIKSNMLLYFLDRDKVLNAAENIRLVSETNIHKETNTLQVEFGYTDARFRGLGLFARLLNEHIRVNMERYDWLNKVQSRPLKSNISSIKAHEKVGFSYVSEQRCTNSDILKILPSDTRILMERKLK